MSILIIEDETTNESNGDNLRINVPLSEAYEYSIDVCGIMVKMLPAERTL
jgi:hypothetical protein